MIERLILQRIVSPNVRLGVKSELEEWMFDGLSFKRFLRAISDPCYIGKIPDETSFTIKLCNSNGNSINDYDVGLALTILREGKKTIIQNESEIGDVLKEIESFIVQKRAVRLLDEYHNDEVSNLEKMRSEIGRIHEFSLKDYEDEFINLSDSDAVNAARLRDFPDEKIIKSSLGVVNFASQYRGYKRGDLVMIAGVTGGGKSTLAIQEAACILKQELKVAAMYLGDLSDSDVAIKMVTALLDEKTLIQKVHENWEDYYNKPEVKTCYHNFNLKAFPPMELDIYDLTLKAKRLHEKFRFDALIVDYDANIKEVDDGLYKEGGLTYSLLKALAQDLNCIVFILSQIKQAFWSDEKIYLSAAADSSKKQHVVDFMITIGRNSDNSTVGVCNLPKVRRGVSDKCSYLFFDDSYGRIKEIKEDDYENRKKRTTEGDLAKVYEMISE